MERLRSRGHILLMCVKAHPELAGVGIENSWGKSAQHFRANNDCVSRHLHQNVLDSLHSSNLTLLRVCKFARRTRDYLLLYLQHLGQHTDATLPLHRHLQLRPMFFGLRGSNVEWGMSPGLSPAGASHGHMPSSGASEKPGTIILDM